MMQGQADTVSSEQEPGLQHQVTTAAVQAHNAAAGLQARGDWGGDRLPQGREGWQGPPDEDPVSPAGSSGSALDPQLYRYAPTQRSLNAHSLHVWYAASDDNTQQVKAHCIARHVQSQSCFGEYCFSCLECIPVELLVTKHVC